MMNYREIVKSVDLDTIVPNQGEELKLRIEILKDGKLYKAQLWRIENYRLKPSFEDGILSDAECMVRDDIFLEDIVEKDEEICLQKCILKIEEKLLSAD